MSITKSDLDVLAKTMPVDVLKELNMIMFSVSAFYFHLTKEIELPQELANDLVLIYFNSIATRLIENETSL